MRRTDPQERAYWAGMARLASERGFLNLSQAYALAALDCPEKCGCPGCLQTKAEVAEAIERRKRTWARVARTIAALAVLVLMAGCGSGSGVEEGPVAKGRRDRASAYAECKAMCPAELAPAIVPDRYNDPLCACVPVGGMPLRSAPGTYGTAKTRSVE